MPEPTTLFLDQDVHRDFITVAHAEADRSDPPVFVGSVRSQPANIEKLVRRVHKKAAHLVFACEAGPRRPIATVTVARACSPSNEGHGERSTS
jgi:hypothetical protein